MLRSGTLAVALVVLWARPERLPIVVVHVDAPPPPAQIVLAVAQPLLPPEAPPPPVVEPEACPAPRVSHSGGELHPPPEIGVLTPSRYDSALLAASNGEAVFVSVDDGDTFRRVLDHRGELGDVAFDCRGRLHVIRGDGELGTYDPRTKTERWTRVATFWTRGAEVDHGRLIGDGTGIAVIGNTPARRDRLWHVRRGEDGRWRAKHLFSDSKPGYWSGITTGTIDVLAGGRIRMLVTPNMTDYGSAECGYSKLFELTFEPDGTRIAARDLGEGGEWADGRIRQDAAGRWLVVIEGVAERLTTEQLAERLAPKPVVSP